MALVGGLEAPPGRIMGHAGAWAAPGEPDAQAKYLALERAGAVMVNHPEKFGERMKTLLSDEACRPGTNVSLFCLCYQVGILTFPVFLGGRIPKTGPSHHETSHSHFTTSYQAEPKSLRKAVSSI